MSEFDFMGRKLVFTDTETGGLEYGDQAWEVALIAEHETLHVMLPIDAASANPVALDIGGYHVRHPQGNSYTGDSDTSILTLDVSATARKIASMTDGVHIVGANPAFDMMILTGLLHSADSAPKWNYHPLDIEAFALGWLVNAGIDLPAKWKSDHIAQLCGVPAVPEAIRHTALGDAEWVHQWWKIVGPQAS